MKEMTYLMSFERMIQLLQENGIRLDSRLIVNSPIPTSRLLCNGQAVSLGNDRFENFFGTWWEVEITGANQLPSRCIYLADSLQDAFRLRPDIDTTYWCSTEEDASRFLAEVSNWQEDDYLWE